jgi:hypothetical protein
MELVSVLVQKAYLLEFLVKMFNIWGYNIAQANGHWLLTAEMKASFPDDFK